MRFNTLTETRQLIEKGKISIQEICQETLSLANTDNSNAILSTCDALALNQAKSLDRQQLENNNELTGIPIIYKDNFNIKNYLTTCASKILKDHVSVYDATVVELMQHAQTLTIGKANMDEFAMGSTNENSAFGHVENPFNSNHCTGGSSGGSAAVVANGIVPIAFGSDTGGSVRQPAAFCGVLGLKPTYGRLSRYGIVAFASSFDQPGIFSRNAYDCASALSATAHFDKKDSTSVNISNQNYAKNLNQSVSNKRIGIAKSLFEKIKDPAISQRYQEAIDTYQKLGIELVDIELPSPELCVAAYYILSSSECSSNLSRFDGVRYGYRSPNVKDLESLYNNSRTEGFGKEVKRRILLGTFALSAGYFDAYFVKAQKMRRLVLNQFKDILSSVDAMMLPTSLTTAPKLKQEFNYNDDMCTITANLAGLPALSHPIGLADGLPVGLQLIGKHFEEDKLLNIVHQFELQTDYHLIRPEV